MVNTIDVGSRPCRPGRSEGRPALHALLPQDGTDRLDRITNSTHLSINRQISGGEGPSSLAKKIEACFRISLDLFQVPHLWSRLISSSSSLLGPV